MARSAWGTEAAAQTFAHLKDVVLSNLQRSFPHPLDGINLAEKGILRQGGSILVLQWSGNVHKGLDLLLQAFRHRPPPSCCQHIQPEFARAFAAELSGTEMFMSAVTLKMRSPEFRKQRDVQLGDSADLCGRTARLCHRVHGAWAGSPSCRSQQISTWKTGATASNPRPVRLFALVIVETSASPDDCRQRAEKECCRNRHSLLTRNLP